MSEPIKVVLLGRKQIAAKSLHWICDDSRFQLLGVVTDSHLQGSPATAAAAERNIPVWDHRDLEEAAQHRQILPDLVLSILYWRKLKGALLFPAARCGVVNFHPAPLPEYKGCGGYNFAILDGLSQWGTTAHYVDSGIDTGSIIDVRRFPICPDRSTARSIEKESMEVMCQQIRDIADRIAKAGGMLATTPNLGGRYISRIEMEAAKQIRLGDDVARKARAFFFPPYEGAWTVINGVRCTVLTPELIASLAEPGTTHLFSAQDLKRSANE